MLREVKTRRLFKDIKALDKDIMAVYAVSVELLFRPLLRDRPADIYHVSTRSHRQYHRPALNRRGHTHAGRQGNMECFHSIIHPSERIVRGRLTAFSQVA